jgi:hypothetical protein
MTIRSPMAGGPMAGGPMADGKRAISDQRGLQKKLTGYDGHSRANFSSEN